MGPADRLDGGRRAADTLVFCLVAFGGILTGGTLVNYVITGYVYKVLVEVILLPVTYAVIRQVKKREPGYLRPTGPTSGARGFPEPRLIRRAGTVMVSAGAGVVVHPGEQALSGHPPDAGRVLGDHRDAGGEQLGEGEVIEADQGDLGLATPPVQGLHPADRDQVLRRDQRRRRIGPLDQSLDLGAASSAEVRSPTLKPSSTSRPAAAMACS